MSEKKVKIFKKRAPLPIQNSDQADSVATLIESDPSSPDKPKYFPEQKLFCDFFCFLF